MVNLTLRRLQPVNTITMEPKFTRGEKCIFSHLVVTFVLLIVLLIVYFIHLCVVNHTGLQAYLPYLRESEVNPEVKKSTYLPIGIVHLDSNILMCNSLLIRYRWSLAPAHCVVARSDPDLADLLRSWKIKYRMNEVTEKFTETTIKRSIAHPHFNSDDYSNNIGLFEHDESLPIYSYPYPSAFTLIEESLMTYNNDLELIGWEDSWHEPGGRIIRDSVNALSLEKCSPFVSPIVELRKYESCVTLKARRDVSIAPGALLSLNSTFVGFFSWGESQGRGIPIVVIDFFYFKDWIRHIISI